MFSNNHNIISRDSTHLRHFLVTLLLWPLSQVSGQRASVHDHLRRLKVHGGFLFTSWSFTYKKRFKNGATPSYLPISNCMKPSWTYRGMHLLPQYARRSALSKGAAETWEKCCVGSKTAAGLNAVRLLFKCAIVTRRKKKVKRGKSDGLNTTLGWETQHQPSSSGRMHRVTLTWMFEKLHYHFW